MFKSYSVTIQRIVVKNDWSFIRFVFSPFAYFPNNNPHDVTHNFPFSTNKQGDKLCRHRLKGLHIPFPPYELLRVCVCESSFLKNSTFSLLDFSTEAQKNNSSHRIKSNSRREEAETFFTIKNIHLISRYWSECSGVLAKLLFVIIWMKSFKVNEILGLLLKGFIDWKDEEMEIFNLQGKGGKCVMPQGDSIFFFIPIL